MSINLKLIIAAFSLCLLVVPSGRAQTPEESGFEDSAASGDNDDFRRQRKPAEETVTRGSTYRDADSFNRRGGNSRRRASDESGSGDGLFDAAFAGAPGVEFSLPLQPSTIRVLKDGEPVTDAHVICYLGYTVEVTIGEQGDVRVEVPLATNPEVPESDRRPRFLEFMTGPDGSLTARLPDRDGNILVPGQSVLVVHPEAGYATTTLKEKDGRCDIVLNEWSTVSGGGDHGSAAKLLPKALARWESFPHGPALLAMSPDERRRGPGLFSIVTSIAGGYENSVPAGRIELTALVQKPAGGITRTNIHWWETFQPGKNEITSVAVDALFISGKVNLTDEILEEITQVERAADGSVTVKRAPLVLRVLPASGEDFVLSDTFRPTLAPGMTIERALRQAVVWGRPGGRRESHTSRELLIPVEEDGRFSTALKNRNYRVTGLWALETATHSDDPEALGYGRVQVGRFADVRISAGAIDSGEMPEVDLGVLEAQAVDAEPAEIAASTWQRPQPDFTRDGSEATYDGRPADDPGIDLPGAEPTTRDDIVAPNELPSTRPNETVSDPFWRPEPAVDPVDQSISKLITRILSAGDQKTRENLREPLQKLLAQKFDAEQQAREQLVEELTARLNEASAKVKERASRRDEIIGQQVQRMLGLPLDDFQPLQQSGRFFRDDVAPERSRDLEPSPAPDRFRGGLREPFPGEDTSASASDAEFSN